MKTKRITTTLIATLLLGMAAFAQCPMTNTAFESGEKLDCNFYFNWQFIWVRAGGARLSIDQTTYKGEKAYRMTLLSTTNSRADAFFCMRDTLTTIFTPTLEPLYYRKGAYEGKRLTVSEVEYSYADGLTYLQQRYYKRTDERESLEERRDTLDHCVYDMMSLLARARSFDYADMKKGAQLTFPVASGYGIEDQRLIYRGRKTVKSDEDGRKYNCEVISLVTKKKGKDRELITFYVTADKNHLPVLLDLNLNFGSAKALLSNMTGVRNSITARKK